MCKYRYYSRKSKFISFYECYEKILNWKLQIIIANTEYIGRLKNKKLLISGATGIGKTSTLIELGKIYDWNLDFKQNNKWFNQSIIQKEKTLQITNDIDIHFLKEYEVKKWTDHYPTPVEFKGGSGLLDPCCKWAITTNYWIDWCRCKQKSLYQKILGSSCPRWSN